MSSFALGKENVSYFSSVFKEGFHSICFLRSLVVWCTCFKVTVSYRLVSVYPAITRLEKGLLYVTFCDCNISLPAEGVNWSLQHPEHPPSRITLCLYLDRNRCVAICVSGTVSTVQSIS